MYEVERQIRNELADELTVRGRNLWKSAEFTSTYERARQVEFESIGWRRAAEYIRPKGDEK